MGYNALIWRAPGDQEATLKAVREETRSRVDRSIPLLHRSRRSQTSRESTARGAQGGGSKRKRSKEDDKDIKKKKMKTLIVSQTTRGRKKK